MKATWQEIVVKAETLPPGHVLKFQAKEMVKEEYGQTREIELKWRKKFKKKFQFPDMSETEALTYCNKICKFIGENKLVKKVIFNSKDVASYAGAHYCKKEIHFKHCFWFPTLIHELGHHCARYNGHGDDYCIALDLIWEVVYNDLTK
jgi:hypothetical protein